MSFGLNFKLLVNLIISVWDFGANGTEHWKVSWFDKPCYCFPFLSQQMNILDTVTSSLLLKLLKHGSQFSQDKQTWAGSLFQRSTEAILISLLIVSILITFLCDEISEKAPLGRRIIPAHWLRVPVILAERVRHGRVSPHLQHGGKETEWGWSWLGNKAVIQGTSRPHRLL